ncbi:MAG TPA: universal stress protein [Puia sp.]|nr:universal stress protein [Puia sp.]
MNKILVATDFSACASNAMEYAMELARVTGVEVVAIHAIGSFEGIFNNTYNALYIEEYHNSKREALRKWAETFSEREAFRAVPVSSTCEVGSVSGVITKYIDANPVELLVMGTMGSTGIAGLFGSNASTMVEKTKTPTLIVPLESKFSADPVITLATDFSTTLSAGDVTALIELIKAFGSPKVTVVNVVEDAAWKTNAAGEAQVREIMPGTHLEFQYIKEDSPTEGILHFVAASATDILCLVKRHHNVVYRIFNTSTVNKVLGKSIKAILVMHE